MDDGKHILAQLLGGVVGCATLDAPNPRRVIPYTWNVADTFGTILSKSCAVRPSPASSTSGRPVPPQSSTSNFTPLSTFTNWTLCGELSMVRSSGPLVAEENVVANRQTIGNRCRAMAKIHVNPPVIAMLFSEFSTMQVGTIVRSTGSARFGVIQQFVLNA